MANINSICKDCLENKLILVPSKKGLQFYQEENILRHSLERGSYWFVLKATRVFLFPLTLNPQPFSQQIDKKIPLGKINC